MLAEGLSLNEIAVAEDENHGVGMCVNENDRRTWRRAIAGSAVK